jgi:hypothetical protein
MNLCFPRHAATRGDGLEKMFRRLDRLAENGGNDARIFGWDLWNEMNAVASNHWEQWTREMLPELKKHFPRSLIVRF